MNEDLIKNEMVIKEEYSGEVLEPEVNMLDSDDGKSKCGEIYAVYSGNFILICAFCNAQFENMRLFGGHIRGGHEHEIYHNVSSPGPHFKINCTSPIIPKTELYVSNYSDEFCFEESSEGMTSEAASHSEEDSDDEWAARLKTDDDNEQSAPAAGTNFACDTCSRKYKTKKSLYRHQRTTGCKQKSPAGDPALFCIPCDRQLKTRRTFRRHRNKHKNGTKPESIDNNVAVETTYPNPEQNEDDGSTQKPEIPDDPSLFCEICNRYFKSKFNLAYHARRHDIVPLALQHDPDYLVCKFCLKICADISERKDHENTHSGVRPYECSTCHKGFVSSHNRKIHMRGHTGDRPYKCPQCPNSYTHKTYVTRHIKRSHLNIRNYPCEICEKRFFWQTDLSRHMRKHSGERPYICEDCGNSFVVLGQLKEHRKRHTQTKNHKCEICGRLFYSNSILRDHQVGHSDAKPFGCEVCGRRFPRIKALRKHMKLHSDVKEYVCNICGKEYAQDSGLYAHKKTHRI